MTMERDLLARTFGLANGWPPDVAGIVSRARTIWQIDDPHRLSTEIINRIIVERDGKKLLLDYLGILQKLHRSEGPTESDWENLIIVWHCSVAFLANNPTMDQFMAKFGFCGNPMDIYNRLSHYHLFRPG
ncbi:MAG: hypothetical protein WC480_01920 [Patescibacteria group bacterium]